MLTAKQEKYVQGLVAGLSQREAYKQAYPSSLKWKDSTVDENASRAMKNSKIIARYTELMNEHKEKALWTREKAVEELLFMMDIAKQEILEVGLEPATKGAFIDSLKELNRLESVYADDSAKLESIKANTELTKAKTGLIKGVEPDTSLMQVLIDTWKGEGS